MYTPAIPLAACLLHSTWFKIERLRSRASVSVCRSVQAANVGGFQCVGMSTCILKCQDLVGKM